MLKAIRNINFGWIIIIMGLVLIVSGISMVEGNSGGKTFVCFDLGCIYVQGISNVVLGIFCILVGLFLVFKK